MSTDVDPSIVVSSISATGAALAAYMAFRAAKGTNKVAEKKVDQEAYDRAVTFYKDQLTTLERQIERLNVQFDRVAAQLATEQDVSNTLRDRIRALESTVALLNTTIITLRAGIPEAKAAT